MKKYQLSYLISAQLSEEMARDLQEKINSLIEKEGGILERVEKISKKRLAYPIKREGEAYFSTLNFHFLPEKLGNLEKRLKEESKILRYLILVEKVPKVLPKIPARAKKPKKVELKEIEKKLEEILGE